MAKILCLSDIHFTKSNPYHIYGESINSQLTDSIESNKFDLLFDAMEEMGPIDLLLFCGDYVLGKDSKEAKKKSMKEFTDFLARVENSENIFKKDVNPVCDRIIIAPGNHDMNREDAAILEEFSGILQKYLTYSEKRGRRQKYSPIFLFDELKVMVACESTVNNSATSNVEIIDLLEKVEELENNEKLKKSIKDVLDKYVQYDIPSITEDARQEFVKRSMEIEKNEKCGNYIKIMLCHHPLLSGVEVSDTIKKYPSTIGGYNRRNPSPSHKSPFMRSLLLPQNKYRLLLNGSKDRLP